MSARNQQGIRPVRFGRYVLLQRIGSGGMAEIYRAKTYGAHGFEKEVAIKKILPNLTDDLEFVEMFINEAKIMVGLGHNNIVQVHDLGEVEGQYFIGMEFVHGKDLLDVLARCAERQLKLPLKLALFIMMETLKGLGYAHQAVDEYGEPLGLIHRDVSPSNVLISYAGNVKVGDFGVAKAATQRTRTEAGTLKGKVGYMSPEQVRGDELDHRSDLFSAGIILHEVLNMRRLFVGGSDLDIMLRVRDIDVERELDQGIALPAELRDVLAKALAREPGTRYATAMAMHDDLMSLIYRYNLRVSNADLAGFMRRLFQKEIEQDKATRRSLQRSNSSLQAIAQEVSRPSIDAPAPGDDRMRYRDSSGTVYGPMSRDTLVNLLSSLPLSDEDQVAHGNGPWLRIQDVSELVADVAERRQVRALSQSSAPSLVAPPAPPASPEGEGEGGDGEAKASRPTTDELAAISRLGVKQSVRIRTGALGDLDGVPFAQLLFDAWQTRANGQLTVHLDATRKTIDLQRGQPAGVVSNNDAELLGNFLVREGVVSQEQLERALERAKRFGGRLGDALVADRVILSHVLFQYLYKQAKLKILEVFSWPGGEYELRLDTGAPAQGYPLGLETLELIVEGIRDHTPTEKLAAFFGRHEHRTLTHNPTPPVVLDTLRLSAREFRIAMALEGESTRSLIERFTSDRVHTENIWRLTYLMLQVQFVSFS